MPGAGGKTVKSGGRGTGGVEDDDEVISEAQQQLQDLLHKQLDTSAASIEGYVK